MTKGVAASYSHRSEGSGKIVDIHFCPNCGTKLYLTFERFPDVVGVYGGTFDDPNWFDLSDESSRHIFLDAARRGTVVPAGINAYGQHATDNEGEPHTPIVFSQHHEVGR